MTFQDFRRWWWGGVLAWLLLGLGMRVAPPAQAAGSVTFTVTVASAYLRSAPNPLGTPTFSTFQGQTYVVTGRTADNTWLALDAAGAAGGTWIRAGFGTVTGNLNTVPVTGVAGGGGAANPGPQPTARPGGVGVANNAGIAGLKLRFTITAKSTYVRASPSYNSRRDASLFKGEVTTAISRDTSGSWVRVLYGGGSLGWLPLGVGKLEGEVMSLPTDGPSGPGPVAVPVVPPAATPTGPFPAWVPTITTHMSAVYHQAAAMGRDPNMFALIGDCNSEEWLFQEVIAVGNWDYVNHPYLAPTVRQFSNALVRRSIAVSGGFNSVSALDWGLADPLQCNPRESPFACELRVTRASLVFIELGTGDHFLYERFEDHYRRMIEYALSIGVLPILRTKADRLETEEAGAPDNYINDVIRRLGAEYDVPVVDFDLATRPMANHGLTDELGHDFHVSAEAIGVHVLSSLQTLYAITHAP